jgi:hypothetical protein
MYAIQSAEWQVVHGATDKYLVRWRDENGELHAGTPAEFNSWTQEPICRSRRKAGSVRAARIVPLVAAHRQILELARQHDREVWFDIHIATDGPAVSPSTEALPTYADALEKIANGGSIKWSCSS